MARKRKICVTENQQKWIPVPIECEDGFTAEDFDGFGGLEELYDYKIDTNPNSENQNDDEKVRKKKPKKKKNKKSKLDVQDDNGEELEMIEVRPDDDDEQEDMSEWKMLSVPDHIIRSLRDQKMFQPTPIQSSTIPVAIDERRNIFGAAPTGSGKTLAFAIPVVTHVVQDKQANADNDHLRAIILTPTRELAVQIKNHVENICRYNGVNIALVVGGLSVQKQQRILARKHPDIIVATPGRLWDLISGGSVPYLNQNSISKVKYLVIDEADRMVEKSHFQELRYIIDLLNAKDNDDTDAIERQIFIFSATLTMMKKKVSKSKKNEQNEEENLIKLLRLDRNTLKIFDLTDEGKNSKPSSEQLKELVMYCLKDEKDLYLYYYIVKNPGKSMLIFCNSIDCIRRLMNIFRFLQFQPLALHSAMPQKRRLTNVERFTTGKADFRLLFATDVASRGLDIPCVDHVVHYQVPRTAEIYVHRTGRTARLNNHGNCLILCDPKEEAFFLRDFSRIINKETLNMMPAPDIRILKKLKDRIRLAHQCDELEHRLRKDSANDTWFKTTAEACEIYDSSDNDDDENQSLREQKILERKLKSLRGQLESLLKKPILIPKQL